MFEWYWKATDTGCDCTDSTYFSRDKIVYAKTCNSTQIVKKCKTMESIPSVNFNFIEGKETFYFLLSRPSLRLLIIGQTG